MKTSLEILLFLGLPVLAGSFMNLETSNFVIFPFALLLVSRIIQLFKRKEITLQKDVHKKENQFKGFTVYLSFTLTALLFILLFKAQISLPEWLVNDDFWAFILLHAALQEIIYRIYLINRLKRVTENKFLIAFLGAVIFAGVHLLLPFSLTVVGMTFVAGFFWSLIYTKYPHFLWVTLSHFTLNMALILT
jgi:membrane protease YdiL (CAAX protease family)